VKEVTVEVDDDLYNYLEFLERTRYIKNKSQAIHKALLLFRSLSMHDWLPDIYRIGENRVIIMDKGMLLDLFESLTENEIYRAGSMTALKRKVLNPEFRDINLTKKANWSLVLNELQNLGWGTFEKVEDEIKIEKGIGSIVVTEKGGPIGIVTKSDLLGRVIVNCRDPRECKIGEIMSSPLISIDRNTPILDAMRKLRQRKVHRLLMSDGEKIVGIVSEYDMINAVTISSLTQFSTLLRRK